MKLNKILKHMGLTPKLPDSPELDSKDLTQRVPLMKKLNYSLFLQRNKTNRVYGCVCACACVCVCICLSVFACLWGVVMSECASVGLSMSLSMWLCVCMHVSVYVFLHE